MDYFDLDGNFITEKNSQDRALSFLYTTPAGSLLLGGLVHPSVSRLAGRFLSASLSKPLISAFIKRNSLDLSDYEKTEYTCFNDFFTRKIKKERRPICPEPNALISPCDCRASVYPIHASSVFTIKNTSYTLASLLHSHRLADRFRGGYAFLLRLTVEDYHRYVFSASGRLSKTYHIDGILHTVNPVANDHYPIYKENTREYCVIHSEILGDILQMEVGAMLVGKIKNHSKHAYATRGEEKGYFEYGGSTIVVLTTGESVAPRSDLLIHTSQNYETKILQGQPLGYRIPSSTK